MTERKTDIVDELRDECLTSCQVPARPDGPNDEEAAVLDRDVRWRAAREIVVGVWRCDANRRTFGYWVSDVGHLDSGFAETGPWIEYTELHPEKWAPLLPPPDKQA